jgi:hypothetical protein
LIIRQGIVVHQGKGKPIPAALFLSALTESLCSKGTSSMKNMSTDFKMKQGSVLCAMPPATRAHTSKSGGFLDSQNDNGQSLSAQPEQKSFMTMYTPTSIRAKVVTDNAAGLIDFNILKNAKINSGFATVYRSGSKEFVETVWTLLSTRRIHIRPQPWRCTRNPMQL